MNMVPQPGQVWEHYGGNRFTVVLIINEGAVDRDKYPLTIAFRDALRRVWTLQLHEFHSRFAPASEDCHSTQGMGVT